MTAANAGPRFKPVLLEVATQGSDVLVIDRELDGSEKLVLLRLDPTAARRIGRELLAGADQVERG